MIAILLKLWYWLKYRRAARVNTREELEIALRAAPPRIIIEGNEALRAYAASFAYRGGEKAAELEAAQQPVASTPAYMVVPTVGRIRDGYRHRDAPAKRRRRFRLAPGTGIVLIAAGGIFAALLMEILSFPAGDPELVRGPHQLNVQFTRRHIEARLPTHAPPPVPPTLEERILHILIPILGALAAIALLYIAWQAIGPGRPVKISWRVETRVPGRLVIARVKTRLT